MRNIDRVGRGYSLKDFDSRQIQVLIPLRLRFWPAASRMRLHRMAFAMKGREAAQHLESRHRKSRKFLAHQQLTFDDEAYRRVMRSGNIVSTLASQLADDPRHLNRAISHWNSARPCCDTTSNAGNSLGMRCGTSFRPKPCHSTRH